MVWEWCASSETWSPPARQTLSREIERVAMGLPSNRLEAVMAYVPGPSPVVGMVRITIQPSPTHTGSYLTAFACVSRDGRHAWHRLTARGSGDSLASSDPVATLESAAQILLHEASQLRAEARKVAQTDVPNSRHVAP